MYKCSKRVYSICHETEHDPNTWPEVVEEDGNLALSEGDQRTLGDQFDAIFEYADFEYILDAFFSFSMGKCDEDSGITEGLDCQVGVLERWIS